MTEYLRAWRRITRGACSRLSDRRPTNARTIRREAEAKAAAEAMKKKTRRRKAGSPPRAPSPAMMDRVAAVAVQVSWLGLPVSAAAVARRMEVSASVVDRAAWHLKRAGRWPSQAEREKEAARG